MAWAQIAVEINGVKKDCMPQTRLARKQQLRGTGKQSRLRSDSSMQESARRVQFKEFMEVIRARRVTEVIA
jgi:hypothetical protein